MATHYSFKEKINVIDKNLLSMATNYNLEKEDEN
jgi:hypothetical protein